MSTFWLHYLFLMYFHKEIIFELYFHTRDYIWVVLPHKRLYLSECCNWWLDDSLPSHFFLTLLHYLTLPEGLWGAIGKGGQGLQLVEWRILFRERGMKEEREWNLERRMKEERVESGLQDEWNKSEEKRKWKNALLLIPFCCHLESREGIIDKILPFLFMHSLLYFFFLLINSFIN